MSVKIRFSKYYSYVFVILSTVAFASCKKQEQNPKTEKKEVKLTNITSLSLYGLLSCGRDISKKTWCWGKVGRGSCNSQNPTKEKPPCIKNHYDAKPLEDERIGKVVQVSANEYILCILNEKKEVWCRGGNEYFSLGTKRKDWGFHKVPIKQAISISSEESTTCALTAAKEVYCWGMESKDLDRKVYKLEHDIDIKEIHVKDTAVVTDKYGSFNTQTMVYAVTNTSEIYYWPSISKSPPQKFDYVGCIKKAKFGSQSICLVNCDKTVSCYYSGLGWLKTLAPPYTYSESIFSKEQVKIDGYTNVDDIAVNQRQVCYVKEGNGKCVRKPNKPLPKGQTAIDYNIFIENVTAVESSNTHTCAITADKNVKCWGWDSMGQCGSEILYDSSSVERFTTVRDIMIETNKM